MLIDPTFAYILPLIPRFTCTKPFVEPVCKPLDKPSRNRSHSTQLVDIRRLVPYLPTIFHSFLDLPDLNPFLNRFANRFDHSSRKRSHSTQLGETRRMIPYTSIFLHRITTFKNPPPDQPPEKSKIFKIFKSPKIYFLSSNARKISILQKVSGRFAARNTPNHLMLLISYHSIIYIQGCEEGKRSKKL